MAFIIAIPISIIGFIAAFTQLVWYDATFLQAAMIYFGFSLTVPIALFGAYLAGLATARRDGEEHT